jgi:hypothetical protein
MPIRKSYLVPMNVEKRARRATPIEEWPKKPGRNAALALRASGTGVVAANQAASVVRTVPSPTPIPTVVHPTPIRPGVTHANRTVVGPDA